MQRSKVLTLNFVKLPYLPVAIFLTFIDTDFKSQKPHFMDLSSSMLKEVPFLYKHSSEERNMQVAEGKKDILEG